MEGIDSKKLMSLGDKIRKQFDAGKDDEEICDSLGGIVNVPQIGTIRSILGLRRSRGSLGTLVKKIHWVNASAVINSLTLSAVQEALGLEQDVEYIARITNVKNGKLTLEFEEVEDEE